jgi:hypothetical protein
MENVTSFFISDIFDMRIAYRPPENASGCTTEIVSRLNQPWYWAVTGSRLALPFPWVVPSGPGVQDEAQGKYLDWRFQWDDVIFNTP